VALLFELVVECGEERTEAVAIGSHFKGLVWTLYDGAQVRIDGFGIYQDETGNWWTWIRPEGVSVSGVATPRDAQQLTEVGNHLYVRLRTAPRFRFAIVAVEVSESFTVEDLPELFDSPRMDGLVLNRALWEQFGSPNNFVAFDTDYVWIPYAGERYRSSSEIL
jgi:hypothetical protein